MNKKELSIRDYWAIISKRRRALLAIFIIFFAAVLAVTFTTTPVYKATAQIFIDTSGNQYNPQQQPLGGPVDNQAYIDTQISILKSEAIAKEVISRLQPDLASNDTVKSRWSLAAVFNFFGAGKKPKTADDYRDETLHKFMDNLTVETVKKTGLVNVSFESKNPELAAKVANETVQVFIKQNLSMKTGPAKEYMGWLDGELSKIKERMNESSSRLEEFKARKDLVAGGGTQTNIPLMALTDLNAKVLAAEARRYSAEIKWQQVRKLSKGSDELMSLPEVINDKLIQDLKVQQGALAKQIAEQSKKYGEKHPQMVRLHNEMDTLDGQIKAEITLIVSSLKNDYEESLKAERSLRAALAREKAAAMSYERRSSEYELRRQDVEGARGLYDQVLKKLQESNVMGSISISNVQSFDQAAIPKKPIRPNKPLNILLGLVLGMTAAVGYALVSEHLDNTYRSPENLEDDLGLPFLGIVPNNDGSHPDTITAITDPMSPVAESFRSIRSSLLLARKEASPRVIQVVSALHSEGKSTVSVNLACIMAAAGDKVLLIDGDMRRPRVHKFFKVSNANGLSSVLTLKATLNEVTTRTSVPNLHFIPSGPLYNTPGELLGGEVMAETVAVMREIYDRIIIDCPPYLGIADSSLLTPHSDGVIIVVRSGRTIREAVMQIKKNMDAIKAEILGLVLNDMERRSIDYYYHYDYTNYISDRDNEGNAAAKKPLTGAIRT